MASQTGAPRRDTSPLRLRVVVALAWCLTLGVSGCNRASSAADFNPNSSRASDPGERPAATQPQALTADQIRSLLFGDVGADTVDERIIVDCMNAAGFEFFTIVDDDDRTDGFETAQRTEEQVELAGYGILIDPVDAGPQTSEVDPNIVYRDSLTAAEQQAYENVFSGGATDVAGVDPESCLGQQMAALDASQPPVDNELYVELLGEFDELVNADSAVVKARQGWSSCMRQAGYSFGSRDEIIDYLFTLADANQDSPPTPEQQAEERALAVTDYGCSEAERQALPVAEERAAEKIIDQYGTDA